MQKKIKSKSISTFKASTQKALRTINQHQKIKQIKTITSIQFLSNSNSINNNLIKPFQMKQKVKLQMVPNSLAYYQMPITHLADPKIIIRHFRGGPIQIFIFYDKMHKDLEKAVHHFMVKDEIILKLHENYWREAKSLIIVFKNDKNLSIFTFRVDKVDLKKRKRQLGSDKSVNSIQNIDISQIFTEQNVNKLLRSRSQRIKSQKFITFDSEVLMKSKPDEKFKKFAQLKQIENQKRQAAIVRIQNLQICKQKSIQLQKISSTCKKLFSTYQKLVENQDQVRSNIVSSIAPVVLAIKFCLVSSLFSNTKQLGIKKTIMIKNYQKKFIKKIRWAYRQTKKMEQNFKIRQKQVFKQIICHTGYMIHSTDSKISVKIIQNTICNLIPAFLLNEAMTLANDYRRIVRTVQRKWKSRFSARTSMLMIYAENQLQTIFKSYPQLKAVEDSYRQKNTTYRLCIQYQKETAKKMPDYIKSYYEKLQQIDQYEQINKQIREFNKTCLKKRLKQELQVPKRPSFPTFRFFRDAMFLKAMIRGELQVQFRRAKKKNPNFGVQVLIKKKKRSKSKSNSKSKKLK